jgi:hypothetical protein
LKSSAAAPSSPGRQAHRPVREWMTASGRSLAIEPNPQHEHLGEMAGRESSRPEVFSVYGLKGVRATLAGQPDAIILLTILPGASLDPREEP